MATSSASPVRPPKRLWRQGTRPLADQARKLPLHVVQQLLALDQRVLDLAVKVALAIVIREALVGMCVQDDVLDSRARP